MKKKDTLNTFNDGLLMDLNPMITPNTVLTNCLNGTLITYNGNENALQNDMGNGRVETAYLPEGYIPLGVAELGGIIYIVSYNPLKDKCQIGSFPSPERNITSDEISEIVSTVQNKQFIDESTNNVINTVVKVKLLSDSIDTLSPGDKYTIYSTNYGITKNQTHISDIGTGITIVDNEPRDVTIHVVAIGDDGKITYLDDTLKWDSNLQYYIKEYNSPASAKKDIDEYRSLVSSAYNIFRSKVSGELALLFELKAIDSLSITWDAEVNDTEQESDKSATITFYANWTSNHTKINPKYLLMSKSECQGNLQTDVQEGWSCEITPDKDRKNDGNDISEEIKVGDFNYTVDKENPLSTCIWNYEVTPAMRFGILPYLKVSGSINFEEIGSGNIYLDEWRYYIKDNSFYLNWGLSAYPEKNKSIKNVTLSFIPYHKADKALFDIENYTEADIQNYLIVQEIIQDKRSYSGNFQQIISLSDDINQIGKQILKNCLYLVDICTKYGPTNDSTDVNVKYIHNYKWLYTTGQWNNQFIVGNPTDFSELTLDDVFTLQSYPTIQDNIKEDSFTNYPGLVSKKEPENKGYSSMGVKIIGVNYNELSSSFTDIVNVKAVLTISPNKYSELFGFNREGTTISSNISNKRITTTSGEPSSDKTSTTSELVRSIIMSDDANMPSDYNNIIKTVLSSTITETINNNLLDIFNATITDSSNDINICVKGALASRINADLVSKQVTVNQTVRPLLYKKEDYNTLGFKDNNTLRRVYLEGHEDDGPHSPFYFQLAYKEWGQPTPNTNDFYNGKKKAVRNWDPSDSFVREYYWDDTYPYTSFLLPWMKQENCPFVMMQYNVFPEKLDENEYTYFGNSKKGISLKLKYNLWARTSEDHYVPINAFWDTFNQSSWETMSCQLRAIYAQIYYAVNDEFIDNYYIVDNINYLETYKETWSFDLNTNIQNVQTSNLYLHLEDGSNQKTLQELQVEFSDKEQLIPNITYTLEGNIQANPYTFQHTFKVDNSTLYDIYENNKLTSIPSLYEISTKTESIIGTAKKTNKFYVYVEDSGLIELKEQTALNINTSGTTMYKDDIDKVVYTPGSTGTRKICKLLEFLTFTKEGILSFDEDKMLSFKTPYFYATGEGGLYYGNCKLGFLIGDTYQ